MFYVAPKRHKLTYKELSGWEADRIDTFFEPKQSKPSQRDMYYILPDYASLAKSLAQPGVTMQLLWEEYVDACRIMIKHTTVVTV